MVKILEPIPVTACSPVLGFLGSTIIPGHGSLLPHWPELLSSPSPIHQETAKTNYVETLQLANYSKDSTQDLSLFDISHPPICTCSYCFMSFFPESTSHCSPPSKLCPLQGKHSLLYLTLSFNIPSDLLSYWFLKEHCSLQSSQMVAYFSKSPRLESGVHMPFS